MVPEPVWPTRVAASGAYCPLVSAHADEPHIGVLQHAPFGLFGKQKPAHSAKRICFSETSYTKNEKTANKKTKNYA